MRTEKPDFLLPKKIDHYLALLCKLYAGNGDTKLQKIIVNGAVRIEEGVDYDNWDGGQYGHDVYFALPDALYLPIITEKEALEAKILADLRNITNSVSHEYFCRVFFEAQYAPEGDWRNESGFLINPIRSVPETATSRIWKNGPYRIFLSHKTEVKYQTARLKEELEGYGVSCFVAHEDIEPTQEWQSEIENALFSMDALVAIMTEDFHNSNWTDQEVGVAFGRGVSIISAKIGRDPYGFIGKFQAVACTWENIAMNMLKILFQRYNSRLTDSYILAINKCQSFNEGNELAKILPLIKGIPVEKAKELIEAAYSNGEICGSFGFSGEKPRAFGLGINRYFKEWTGIDYVHEEVDKEQSSISTVADSSFPF